jgi:biphenyl-2,3-diol 1,2-dioxygenase
MGVATLGYIGFEVADLGAWRSYATNFLGLMDVSLSDAELRFRADTRAWRISVIHGKADDLAFVGFEVKDAASLALVCASLRAAGFETTVDSTIAKRRGVTGLASATDPSGIQVEIYFGADECSDQPVVSPAGVRGFVMGDQGLGHIALHVSDMEMTKRFYMEGLGFRLSDMIEMEMWPGMPAVELAFLHCNPRHHTLALVPASMPKRLNHLMLQVNSMDDVGIAHDRTGRLGVRISDSLGRHTNDHMFSFYADTPSGFQVEFGWGGRTIDENWTVVRHKAQSIWGHKPAAPRAGEAKQDSPN